MQLSVNVYLEGVVVMPLDLTTGGRGFNTSRCTIECHLGQVVDTHVAAIAKQYRVVSQ